MANTEYDIAKEKLEAGRLRRRHIIAKVLTDNLKVGRIAAQFVAEEILDKLEKQ